MLAERFQWYCHKVIPLVYDESLSYYEVLCKLTEYIKDLSAAELELEKTFNLFKVRQDELELQFGNIAAQWANYQQQLNSEWADYQSKMNQQYNSFLIEANNNYNAFKAEVLADLKEMSDLLDAIKNGDYVDLYLDSLKNYIDQNLQEFVARIAKQVVFGIDNQGRMIAWIPENWDFLQFGTIQEGDLYGHLTIAY